MNGYDLLVKFFMILGQNRSIPIQPTMLPMHSEVSRPGIFGTPLYELWIRGIKVGITNMALLISSLLRLIKTFEIISRTRNDNNDLLRTRYQDKGFRRLILNEIEN